MPVTLRQTGSSGNEVTEVSWEQESALLLRRVGRSVLTKQLPVDREEQGFLPCPEPLLCLDGFGDVHGSPFGILRHHRITEWPGQRPWFQLEQPLDSGEGSRLRRGLSTEPVGNAALGQVERSEERRVGKECRSR